MSFFDEDPWEPPRRQQKTRLREQRMARRQPRQNFFARLGQKLVPKKKARSRPLTEEEQATGVIDA